MSLSEWIAQEEKGQDKLATDASISLYFCFVDFSGTHIMQEPRGLR